LLLEMPTIRGELVHFASSMASRLCIEPWSKL
jgi:hypothetical protein